MSNTIWVSVLLLFIFLFVGVQYLDPLQKETMRTLYMPTERPIVQYVIPNYYGASYSTQDMNQWVDYYVGSYFDDTSVPYLDTIDLYVKYVVNKGVLKQEYKNKMRDMCHYLINIVIPNLPTVENPDPKVEWPKIEWLSDDWKSYNYSFNLDAMANLFGGSTVYKRTSTGGASKKSTSKAPGSSSPGIDTPGQDSPGSNSPGTTTTSTSSSTGCNTCPTDCFNQLMTTLSTKKSGSSTSTTTGTSSPGSDTMINSTSKYKSTTGKDHVETSGSGAGGSYRAITVDQVIVTNEVVKNPSSLELNDWVFSKMNYYIDLKFDLYPTKQAQQDFANFVKMYGPIDRAHKNKLRDLVYYFMENIIPGLPTQQKPVCYVEWRPIRWLSNSNL
jgi:hypothetical protein